MTSLELFFVEMLSIRIDYLQNKIDISEYDSKQKNAFDRAKEMYDKEIEHAYQHSKIKSIQWFLDELCKNELIKDAIKSDTIRLKKSLEEEKIKYDN